MGNKQYQWRPYNEIAGSMTIKTFLNFNSKPEEILYQLCKFYTACKDCVKFSIRYSPLKFLREDTSFNSEDILFYIFGSR